MDKIVIEGGYALEGKVQVSGAKNAALPALSACLLTPGTHRLHHIPRLKDVYTIRKIMEKLGVRFTENGDELEVNTCLLYTSPSPRD